MRLDLALVSRGLARSRNQAVSLIEQSLVMVNGSPAARASRRVKDSDKNLLLGQMPVARSADKLVHALQQFDVQFADYCLDIGASTGGFSQVLLEKGAWTVLALDVGRNQLSAELRADLRVIDFSGRNVREMLATDIPNREEIGLVAVDLSFISLRLVARRFLELAPNATFIILIKPQFELQKFSLNSRGVVESPLDREVARTLALTALSESGLRLTGLCVSSITGTRGNVEYLAHLVKGRGAEMEQFIASVR
jgi:23S rRNA (cytidine1920-2'-O)/16S rRNA (cytidine1409-2'-O)-methyltransferase